MSAPNIGKDFDEYTGIKENLIYSHKLEIITNTSQGEMITHRQALGQRNPYDLTWDVSVIETPANDLAKKLVKASVQQDPSNVGFYEAITAMEHAAGSIADKNGNRVTLALGEAALEDQNGNLCRVIEGDFPDYHYKNHPAMQQHPGHLMAMESMVQSVAQALGSSKTEIQIKTDKQDGPMPIN